jgi:hypothetical protein
MIRFAVASGEALLQRFDTLTARGPTRWRR